MNEAPTTSVLPAFPLNPVFPAYALARRTFVRGNRRCRWLSTFEVRIVEPS